MHMIDIVQIAMMVAVVAIVMHRTESQSVKPTNELLTAKKVKSKTNSIGKPIKSAPCTKMKAIRDREAGENE